MFIQTEATPNPLTVKFLPGREVTGAAPPQDFPSAASAHNAPLAQALFAIAGVDGVFFGSDFIAVSKCDGAPAWDDIKPQLLGAMTDFFASGAELSSSAPHASAAAENPAQDSPEDDETTRAIKQILETHVRPAVAQDGGDIVFERFADGVAWLRLRGACAGCPASAMTLQQGVAQLLQHYVPAVQEVRALDDDAAQ